MSNPHFVYIADVYCPWCYGFGPVMARMAREHPAFPVHVIGGNLISKPLTLKEDARQSPNLVDFWHEVERMTGQSLEGAIEAVQTERDVRLYSPGADEIFTVMKAFSPGHELEQFRYLEDMFYRQGRDIFTEDALKDIAGRWNLDVGKFESALDEPRALRATEQNLKTASELMGEITSYPSVLLAAEGQIQAVSRGFVHYETVNARLEDVLRDMGINSAPVHCSRQNGCTAGKH